MPDDKVSTTAPFAFIPGPDTLERLPSVFRAFNGELFHFAAQRLRAQAAYVDGLAECKGPTDILRNQVEFLQAAWKAYVEEASRAWSSAVVPGR